MRKPTADSSDQTDRPAQGSAAAELPVGYVVGEVFVVRKVLGRGANGVVYLGWHKVLDRLVCLKLIQDEWLRSEAETRHLMREAKILSSLEHPGLARVHQFCQDEQLGPYVVTEYAGGETLSDILRCQPLNPQRVVAIFASLCDVMHYVHGKGIVHRDLKPANVIVTTDESGVEAVRVIDFGLARRYVEHETSGTPTWTGGLLGTPSYMSPEQCRGHVLDARSDVYSLGCMLYEALCGAPPYIAESPLSVMELQVNCRLSKWDSVRPVPADLKTIVLKAMEKGPANRYASMLELKEALESADLQHAPQETSFAGRRLAIGVVMLSVVLLAMGTVLYCSRRPAGKDVFLPAKMTESILRRLRKRTDLRKETEAHIIDYYRQWLGQYGDDPAPSAALDIAFAKFYLGSDLLRGGEQSAGTRLLEEAGPCLQRAWKLELAKVDPNWDSIIELRQLMPYVFFSRGRVKEGEETVSSLVEQVLARKDVPVGIASSFCEYRGQYYLSVRRPELAAQYFSRACDYIRKESQDLTALQRNALRVSTCQWISGQQDKSAKTFRKASQLVSPGELSQSDYLRNRFEFARSCIFQDVPAQALEYLRDDLDSLPVEESFRFVNLKMEALLQLRQYDQVCRIGLLKLRAGGNDEYLRHIWIKYLEAVRNGKRDVDAGAIIAPLLKQVKPEGKSLYQGLMIAMQIELADHYAVARNKKRQIETLENLARYLTQCSAAGIVSEADLAASALAQLEVLGRRQLADDCMRRMEAIISSEYKEHGVEHIAEIQLKRIELLVDSRHVDRAVELLVPFKQMLAESSRPDPLEKTVAVALIEARILGEKGKGDEAVDLLRDWLNRVPKTSVSAVRLLQSLAFLLVESDRRNEAIAELEKVLAFANSSNLLYMERPLSFLAKLYAASGRYEESEGLFKRLSSELVSDPSFGSGQYATLLTSYEKLCRERKDYVTAERLRWQIDMASRLDRAGEAM